LCGSEVTRKIKQLEVEGGEHVPQCPIAGDANDPTKGDPQKKKKKEFYFGKRMSGSSATAIGLPFGEFMH